MSPAGVKEALQGKNVLVTGHTGFKGSWLCAILREMGCSVSGFALPAEELSLYNIMEGESWVDSHLGDLRNQLFVQDIVHKMQPDLVFHMAAQPLVLDSYQDPVYTFAVNTLGTAHLLEAVRTLGKPCAVVTITTDKVYENQEWIHPYRETDRLGGYDPYSASKACAELVANSFRQSFFPPSRYSEHQVSLSTVRAGNVIGGGDFSDNRILPDMAKAWSKNQPVLVRNPNAVRPWQHVLEALWGYVLLATRQLQEPASERWARAWNFGPSTEDALSVDVLVKLGTELWDGATVIYDDNRNVPHEAHLLRLDSSQARLELPWATQWGAPDAVGHTLEWYRAFYNGQESMAEFTVRQVRKYLTAIDASEAK